MYTTVEDAIKLQDLTRIPVCFASIVENMVLNAMMESAIEMPTNADPADGTT